MWNRKDESELQKKRRYLMTHQGFEGSEIDAIFEEETENEIAQLVDETKQKKRELLHRIREIESSYQHEFNEWKLEELMRKSVKPEVLIPDETPMMLNEDFQLDSAMWNDQIGHVRPAIVCDEEQIKYLGTLAIQLKITNTNKTLTLGLDRLKLCVPDSTGRLKPNESATVTKFFVLCWSPNENECKTMLEQQLEKLLKNEHFQFDVMKGFLTFSYRSIVYPK